MNFKTECVAMLLAGGQGSRLGVLTKEIAKPAIPFGGKYRIIDFPLSNCVNSGIDTVGVLTQYQPLVLNDYIGSGQSWDLDRLWGGVHILPPYQHSGGSDWYKGTANAIYQNISFIEQYDPEYVLILSGDHIYKMDYSLMIAAHEKSGADCTIAVLDVPMEEASRFGIMNTKLDGTIYEFEEKPAHPKSTKASMGIYVFGWKQLLQYLIEDEANPASDNDFGKNIIPSMLKDNRKLVAFEFSGYWKDVGTIDSLWEANMDILNPNISLELDDAAWKIYSGTRALPPYYIARSAGVQNVLVSEGCQVFGDVQDSVLFSGVQIGEGAKVRDSVIMPGAVIESDAEIEYAIIGENAIVKSGVKIGARPESIADVSRWGIATVGPEVVVNNDVLPSCMIGKEESR